MISITIAIFDSIATKGNSSEHFMMGFYDGMSGLSYRNGELVTSYEDRNKSNWFVWVEQDRCVRNNGIDLLPSATSSEAHAHCPLPEMTINYGNAAAKFKSAAGS